MKGVNEVNERNDDRLECIVGLLRKRVAACDQLIDEARGAGKRIDAGILLHRREEAKAILATVLEIVEANAPVSGGGTGQDDPLYVGMRCSWELPPGKYHRLCSKCNGAGKRNKEVSHGH